MLTKKAILGALEPMVILSNNTVSIYTDYSFIVVVAGISLDVHGLSYVLLY
jgi:hypothetical protein